MTASERWRGVAEQIRRSATKRGRGSVDCCVIEGARLHERALRAGARIASVLLAESCARDPAARSGRLIAQLRQASVSIDVVPDAVVVELTEGRGRPQLVGLVEVPEPADLTTLLNRRTASAQIVLVGCEIEDPGNVGALVRTALGSGAAAMAGVGLTDPWHPKAVRTSMGSVFKLPLVPFASVDSLLPVLDSVGARIIGAASSGGTPLDRLVFDRRPVAILLGSEAFGLPDEVRRKADDVVSIPMAPDVDSYSVNAAAAMLLYEFACQTRPSPQL